MAYSLSQRKGLRMEARSSLLLTSAIIFVLFSHSLFASNAEHKENYQACFEETLLYVHFDPIPQNVRVGESFVLGASIPESVKNEFPENNPLILGIVPQPDPDQFSYIGPPLNPFEVISKEGGRWEWKFKAKEHGIGLSIDFRVGILKKNNFIVDNCTYPISIDIKNKPIYLIVRQSILKYIIYPLIVLLGWLFATIPTLRNWLDSFIAKILRFKRKEK